MSYQKQIRNFQAVVSAINQHILVVQVSMGSAHRMEVRNTAKKLVQKLLQLRKITTCEQSQVWNGIP